MLGPNSTTVKDVVAPQALLALLAQSGHEATSNEKLVRRMDFQRTQSNRARAIARLQEKLENSLHINKNKLQKKNKNTCKDSNRVLKHSLRFTPHIGFESLASCTALLSELANMTNMELDDAILRKIEGIVALMLNLQECKSAQHFFSAVFLYVRDLYDSSVTKQVMNYIQTILDELPYSSQGPELFDPSWLELLRSVQTNWAMVKGNRAFRQFSKLLGVLVTLGLCDASNLKFEIAGFKVFDEDILKRHMGAFDLLDAVFGTVTYFAEGFYLCFQTGSIQPLLVNDFAVLELDNEYVTVLAWWDLVKNGNLERFLNVSESEFAYRLKQLIVKLTNVLPTLTGIDKKIVADKLLKIKIISNDYTASKLAAGIRRAPFAIELFGDSSQGKTTFGDQLLDALLTSAGLPIDKEYRASINTSDKFISNWTSDKLVAIFDDLSNTKSNFVETSPTNYIIDFCNNQMAYANKADLDGKGKCFIEPELVLVTTNVKHLNAAIYSNCPFSIQRRMDLVMTVQCKPEFQRVVVDKEGYEIPCGVDSAKVRERYTINGVYTPPAIDDIWSITVERAVAPASLTVTAEYAPVSWRGELMVEVSATKAIQCAIEMYNMHRTNQASLIDGMRNRPRTLKRCGHTGCIHMAGFCPDHDEYENQLGYEAASALFSLTSRCKSMASTAFERSSSRIEKAATEALYRKATKFLDKWDWLCILPDDIVESDRFVDFMMWYNADSIYSKARYNILACIFLFVTGLCVGVPFTMVFMFCLTLASIVCNKNYQRNLYISELKKRQDVLPTVFKGTREKYAKTLCQVAAGVATLYFMAKIYKHYVKMQAEQSSLEPETPEEVAARDAEPNVWSSVSKRPLPTSDYSKRVSVEQLQRMVEGNLVYASLSNSHDPAMMANLLFLKSNLLLIPDHYFTKGETLDAVCYKEDSRNIGGNFKTKLCKSASYRIPCTDLRICYTSTGGSKKDLTKYLPLSDKLSSCPAIMAYRHKSGELMHLVARILPCETNNGTGLFMGGEYKNLSGNTFNGMCGATWVSDTKDPCILGIHLGGKAGTPYGCFGTFTQDQVKEAEKRISAVEGTLITGEGGSFSPHMFGEDFTLDSPLHEKSPLRYLPIGSQFEYFGSCKGQSTSRSDVRCTPISKWITMVCGVENVWGPPKMQPEWFGWQKALENASEPARPFPHDLLAISVRDYKSALVPLIRSTLWNKIKPLTESENINGIPGCKFIDAINLSTSIGYPLTGTKRKHVIEESVPGNTSLVVRRFTPFIMDEIHKCERLYIEGKRAYTVAKACKKDEVLPRAKEKCRIFYGNPITLTFLVRKYYLPVLRFLQMNPLKSECAVGINSHGPEWDEFYKHTMYYGEGRLFGGDYGKYDQKLPSQLLLAALRVLIDLARECEYTDQDIRVMESMAGDLVYSLIAVNGDLIGLQSGTHISGNSLTVILNGICGSLNLRNYFYSRYPASIPFREAAHMMTYGDDNIGTVSSKYPEFNIKGCSEFLAEFGQEYTMPDKESELKPYLDPKDFEFLKRFNVFHKELNCNIGALLEKSIFKSLHCYMRPKKCELTPQEACALNIDGALREWFNHGRDVYELRREQMREVAILSGISHMCTGLDLSYYDRCKEWKSRYIDKEELPEERFIFDVQSGTEQTPLYAKAMADIDMHILCVNSPIVHQNFGEIDILFVKFIGKSYHYLAIEVKESHCVYMRRRGRRQLRRIVAALHILQPKCPIIGLLLTPYGYELVEEAGGVGSWHNIGLPMFNTQTQLSLETDSQLSF